MTNDNMNNNYNKDNSKTIKINFKTIIGIIAIPIIVLCVLMISFKITQKRAVDKYQIIVEEYLENKYHKNFNIDLSSTGFKSREFEIDHSFGRIGHYFKIRQYVFKINDSNTSEDFYVTIWENIKNGQYEINEVNGEKNNKTETSYEKQQMYKNKIDEVKPQIEKILSNNYKNYSIESNINDLKMEIIFNSSIRNEINLNFETLESITKIDLHAKDKYMTLILKFNDYIYDSFSGISDYEIIKKYFNLAEQMTQKIDEYISDYSMTYGPRTNYTINIPKKILSYDFIPLPYSFLYEELKTYLVFIKGGIVSVNTNIYLNFDDCKIQVKSGNSIKDAINEIKK